MTSKQPRDMSASVRARLMNVAKQNGEAFDLVLVRFAIERLLYRLSQLMFRDLTEIAARLADFLMPPADAASQGKEFRKFWKPIDGWIEKLRK